LATGVTKLASQSVASQGTSVMVSSFILETRRFPCLKGEISSDLDSH
jgi:hypothetical protein